jgi:Tol biopolymer transport system component
MSRNALLRRALAGVSSSVVLAVVACQDSSTAPAAATPRAAALDRAPITSLVADSNGPILYAKRVSTGAWQIFRVNSNSTGLTQLTTGAEHLDPTRQTKGAKKIAYVERTSITQSRIIVADSNGANPVAVTGNLRDVRHPSFNSTGDVIAFSAAVPYSGGLTFHQQVFTVNATGGSLTRVTFDNEDDTYATWRLPNQIAYIGGPSTYRYVVGINPTTKELLGLFGSPTKDISSFGFSADGQQVAFVHRKGTEIWGYGTVKNGVIVATGGTGETYGDPTFSPDMKRVAFVDRSAGVSRMFIASVTGSGGWAFVDLGDTHSTSGLAWAR